MAYVFPKYRQRTNMVVDMESHNENMLEIANEVDGSLNEHNWKNGAFGAGNRAKMDKSCAYNVYTSFMYDTYEILDPGDTHANTTFAATMTGAWETIDDLALDIDSKGGLLWVLVSLGHHSDPSTPVAKISRGVSFGIKVNGTLIPESVVGSLESGNDPISAIVANALTARSIQRWSLPIALDAIIPVSRGKVSIEAVLKSDSVNLVVPIYVHARELIVIEMINAGTL